MIRKIVVLSLLLAGCAAQKPSKTQGIAGEVRWVEGNLMPAINDTTYAQRAKGTPISKEIYIYKATKMKDTHQGVFFQNISSPLARRVQTDEQGKFKVDLPPGKYSLFVKEKEGLFASTFDGDGYINPVQVEVGEYAQITILVNYKAFY